MRRYTYTKLQPAHKLLGSKGFTLIEVLISAGLLAIVALGVTRFFSNMEKSRAFFAAKKHGSQANAQILTRFEKEFFQRTISGQGAFNSGFIIANGGFQTDILRSQRANISSSFLRRYETRCQPIQGSSSASSLLSNVKYTPPYLQMQMMVLAYEP